MGQFLRIIGFILIIIGVIGGFSVYDGDIAETYKDIEDRSYMYDADEILMIQTMHDANVSLTIQVVAAGILAGALFLALGTMINVLNDILKSIKEKENTNNVKQSNQVEDNQSYQEVIESYFQKNEGSIVLYTKETPFPNMYQVTLNRGSKQIVEMKYNQVRILAESEIQTIPGLSEWLNEASN
ncbi:hypothetical protein [Salirhabdus sp. Marseille-P4669]|uniref:hypothetical protein n=1 Tax=Salirhabdus sp. Marseille-P4669 TaxID=2042310 RepID=UPI000C7C9385|nr:hypothetical protein [Salirhabdus sp. Marseille-P4669]